ncbi:MAG: phosphoribosylglycinamide formyltransferase [Candidatus Doudnabacteria bacterium RIFCSPLOWO2_02_FULL_42_9]|uniref:Phosphoribosylglycinamide formyltransferase n=1 Tax=Candidatus Doudnabacteria bacterium RIFCSPHIGHO2_01_FULL_41_86 TaxID=1817821 RepID=A0A1F5N9J7_9BACT|nr:MAG: phosphoribosylglycinamide formyltransferase [Candidatus Doudnabacteria bacterium RIFCSPHIGHO2_01_FULL_41_86]OGE75070.1 MAG: phosphoribosylglycinamide formyltransferase [Candidatus Doudnabacteria bacterium RIFCSPHIGHO2_01_43_10]OGE85344.1 MAG: phosphoribosylglycinamide formyltransferase [Candidatus Doudnabacteria bacterium RIFCSPHIGHO2_12_FULL_42_22]OGE86882.1 MAG: phosphoribosylglycinamide formyltransferase [Candidatus Doudnabacteria bacterium RIFCSPHIGHO2_02_FULL_42_25]OGE92481.1 MAG: 
MANKKRLGILISGRGSNMVNIARKVESGIIDAKVSIVISDVAEAPGLDLAKGLGLKTLHLSPKGMPKLDYDNLLAGTLLEYEVNIVILAGFMRLVKEPLLAAFRNDILNIHPSLLPSFPGLHAHRDVLAHGAKVSGCTVHLVNNKTDDGPIIVQRTCPVWDTDTEETLAARVLEQEHIAFPEAINIHLAGKWMINGRRFVRG